MKNINWSKWIAIALSIFIVTQFVQVSFLAARRFGGNAGGNATEASGVAGIYEGLLGAVGEDNGLVMSAKAAGESASVVLSETSLDMSSGAPSSLTFKIHINDDNDSDLIESSARVVSISLPLGLIHSGADVPGTTVNVEGTKYSDDNNTPFEIASYSVTENRIDISISAIDISNDLKSINDGTITISDLSFDDQIAYNATLPSTWTVDGQDVSLTWPNESANTASIAIEVNDTDTGTALASNAITFSLTKDGAAAVAPTITNGTGSLTGLSKGAYVLTQTATADNYSVADPAVFSFNVNHFGTVTTSDTRYSTGTVAFENAPDPVDPTITINLKDSDNNDLAGDLSAARFSVSGGSITNSAATVLTLTGYTPGSYTLTETAAPNSSYQQNTTSFGFTIGTDGTITPSSVDASAGSWGGSGSNATLTIKHNAVTFSPTITLTLADSAGTTITGVTSAAFAVNGSAVTPNASGVLTLTNYTPGAYELTETAAPSTAYSRNTTFFAFAIDSTGNITVATPPAATAGVWTGTGTPAAALTIKHAAIPTGSGSLTITRNVAVPNGHGTTSVVTPLTGSGNSVSFALYTKSGSTYSPVSGKTATTNTSTGVATISDITAGTYYVKETSALTYDDDHRYSGKADYAHVVGSETTNIMNADGYAEVTISGNTSIVMNDNPQYTIKLVNSSGNAISGQNMILASTDFYQGKSKTTPTPAITFNSGKTQASWTSGDDGAVFDGELCFNKAYTLTTPSADGSGTEDFEFSVGGTTITRTAGTAADFAYSDGVITITRNSVAPPATISVKLVDSTTNAAIPQSGVTYKLAEYTGENPTGTETPLTQVPTTNASGVMTVSLPVPASGSKKYYLTETTYPTGYRANNTTSIKIYYTFSINQTGTTVTYPTPSTEAATKGWSTSPTGGIQIIKYTTDTQEQLSIQLKDTRGTVYKLGSAFDLYTANTGTTKVSGAVVSVSDGGLITSTGLPSAGTQTTVYLGETTAPTGYVAKTSRFAITVNTDGTLTYPNSGDLQRNSSGTGATLTYVRKDAVLTLNRSAGTSDPATLTYELHKNATASDASSGTITLTKSGTTFTGASTASLDWNTDYYVKETTADYAGKDGAIHGPFSFSPTMSTSGTTPEGTVWTAVPADMTMTATLVPAAASDPTFVLNRSQRGSSTAVEAASGAQFSVRGVFSGSSAETEKTFTTDSYGKPTTAPTGFLTGKTYTVTETKLSASGYTKVIFTFTNTSSTAVTIGTVTGGKATASGTTINMTETFGSVKFKMEVCTAEQGDKFEDRVDDDAETVTAAGFAFYLYSDSDARTKITDVYNASGTKLSNISTNSSGEIEICGLSDATYYLKYAGTISDSDAKKATAVDADTKSIFKFTVTNGTITSEGITKSNDTGNWRARRGRIRAYLKEGSIKLTAGSDKSYYVYRLYSGSDRAADDNRSEAKMNGKTREFTADEKKNFIKVAGLDDLFFEGLKFLDSLFTLKAYAAEDAKTITYPKDSGTTWELIGSVQPGKGNTSDLSGLIAGQVYLIREGDSESAGDSDGYYLATPTASGKTLATSASAANTANTANTARTTNGTGTANSGSKAAGGARGSATGDAGDLWRHLIIMLIAFDALVADLLYMSRKKQRVIRRR